MHLEEMHLKEMHLKKLCEIPTEKAARLGVEHTPREIAQQPRTWGDTFRRVRQLESGVKQALADAGIGSSDPASLILLGAGTSDFIGNTVAGLLRTNWRCPTEAIATTDLATHAASLLVPERRYVSISFSRSGRSPESVAALDRMLQRTPTAPQFVVSCDAASPMATAPHRHTNALALVLDEKTNDRGLAMTSSYSNMVVAAQAMSHCGSHCGSLDSYQRIVEALQAGGERMLAAADPLAVELSRESFSKVCFLGSGSLKGLAMELALKLGELSAGRLASLSESYLGIRHGPLSALDADTLVVALVSADPKVRSIETDLLRQLRRDGIAKKVIAVIPRADRELDGCTHVQLETGLEAFVSDDYRAPVDVIFGQLLALHCCLAQGLQPDSPSPNGIIHRVVKGVQLAALTP